MFGINVKAYLMVGITTILEKEDWKNDGRKKEVVLEKTLLFREGGWLNGHSVHLQDKISIENFN